MSLACSMSVALTLYFTFKTFFWGFRKSKSKEIELSRGILKDSLLTK